MILKKFLNFWKSESRDSYKKNSYNKKKRVYSLKYLCIGFLFISFFFIDCRIEIGSDEFLDLFSLDVTTIMRRQV